MLDARPPGPGRHTGLLLTPLWFFVAAAELTSRGWEPSRAWVLPVHRGGASATPETGGELCVISATRGEGRGSLGAWCEV